MTDGEEKVGLGGGCHWCTEAVFQSLRGVIEVAQGFIRSAPPHDAWSEAVVVRFDPREIDLTTLIEVHLRTHASTSAHKMRSKYRSAVYAFSKTQTVQAAAALKALQQDFNKPLQTMALCHKTFKLSDTRFQDYYATNPERPFCQTHIDPKLQLLRNRFTDLTSAAP